MGIDRLRALVVEDKEGERGEYAALISSHGYQVETAKDGASALDKLSMASYDALVLDIGLPDINGFEILKCVTHEWPDTKVIVLTGEFQDATDVIRAYRDKVYDYVLKSATMPREIATALNRIREEKKAMLYTVPSTIKDSHMRFRKDYPDPLKTAFIMMKFGQTTVHERIVSTIRSTLSTVGITALRADDKAYHDDLFPNILTYMHSCGFGIAIFERIEAEVFNPNVSLEVGYMLALGKPVCLLKDKTLNTLQTDLVGKLYTTFDFLDPGSTIPPHLSKWLADRELLPISGL